VQAPNKYELAVNLRNRFNVLNCGCAVSFPSHGWQPEFHEQFGAILKSLGIE
jgi:hypothetical protein